MLHPMGPHPQSMGFQPKTETNTADYQVSELKKKNCVCVSLIMSFWNFAALKALDFWVKAIWSLLTFIKYECEFKLFQ